MAEVAAAVGVEAAGHRQKWYLVVLGLSQLLCGVVGDTFKARLGVGSPVRGYGHGGPDMSVSIRRIRHLA